MNPSKKPADLAANLKFLQKKSGLPPVHQWNPPFCGDIDMRINRDGSWHFNGSPIDREALIRLFASVLRRDDDDCYYLVTPVEKVRIQVEDVPFIIISAEVRHDGTEYIFTTNVGDEVVLDKDHPLIMKAYGETGEAVPYIGVRDRLEARFHRNVFYQLVETAQCRGDEVVITSKGHDYSLGSIKEGE